METFFQLLLSGIAQGCVYGLVAIGFVLIYKATEMVNFAQGDIMMLGAFITITLINHLHWNYFLAVVIAIGVMGLFGLALERLLLRRMIGESPFAVLMVTIGIGFVMRSVAGMIWGHNPRSIVTPYTDQSFQFGAVVLPIADVVVIVATVVLCSLTFLFFRYTRFGIAMQATSQNQLAANYVGISVKRVVAASWALAAAIATIAGILLLPLKSAYPEVGLILGIKAFAAAIVGGFGSLPGAMIGGLVIGLAEVFTKFWVDAEVGFSVSETSVYILLLIMLIVRPSGLFASLQKKKV
ncbi:MAG: branched-chain amino acid ABC transporter permease [Gammaproteobacteria bacterium]|nr:branched-chain amino acid ABC transporter permease [Gammaproteobacteria bacterium]MYF38184.1 branched-chain amino acid ABC transporter permease [Gammaproteobacteria bacterium]